MNTEIAYQYSRDFEHSKWMNEIPYLKFNPDWEIQITPPFAGAVVRFCVRSGGVIVSVYLDCYGNLGAVSEPYWEIYPYEDDVFRCGMYETEELIKAIEKSINDRLNDYGSIR